MQIVTGKCKPVQTTLRQMGAACNKAAVLLTFQRSLCVEEGILMLTWYDAISESAVQKLVMGKWNTAGGVSQHLQPRQQQTLSIGGEISSSRFC